MSLCLSWIQASSESVIVGEYEEGNAPVCDGPRVGCCGVDVGKRRWHGFCDERTRGLAASQQ